MDDRPSPDQQIRRGVRLIAVVGLAGLDPETRRRILESSVRYLADRGMSELGDDDLASILQASMTERTRRMSESAERARRTRESTVLSGADVDGIADALDPELDAERRAEVTDLVARGISPLVPNARSLGSLIVAGGLAGALMHMLNGAMRRRDLSGRLGRWTPPGPEPSLWIPPGAESQDED